MNPHKTVPGRQVSIPRPLLDRDKYTIGMICALETEEVPILSSFDHIFWKRRERPPTDPTDTNTYCFGTICERHVVLATVHGDGNIKAKDVAVHMFRSFRYLKLCFLIGICAVAPTANLMLGDVVMSTEIVYWSKGHEDHHGLRMKNMLGEAPNKLKSAVKRITLPHYRQEFRSSVYDHLKILKENHIIKDQKFRFPGRENDILYKTDYLHVHRDGSCKDCNASQDCEVAVKASCDKLFCSSEQRVRPETSKLSELDSFDCPNIYVGKLACGDVVLRHAEKRDTLAKTKEVIAFEMESAAVWDTFPVTIVIKGGCDYADSHKNKQWQKWAAMTAAACTKAFIDDLQMGVSPDVVFETQDTLTTTSSYEVAVLNSIDSSIRDGLFHLQRPEPTEARNCLKDGLDLVLGVPQLDQKEPRRRVTIYLALTWLDLQYVTASNREPDSRSKHLRLGIEKVKTARQCSGGLSYDTKRVAFYELLLKFEDKRLQGNPPGSTDDDKRQFIAELKRWMSFFDAYSRGEMAPLSREYQEQIAMYIQAITS